MVLFGITEKKLNREALTLSSIITKSFGSVRSIFKTRYLVSAGLLPTRKYRYIKKKSEYYTR